MRKNIKLMILAMLCFISLFFTDDSTDYAASGCVNNYMDRSNLTWSDSVFPVISSGKKYKKFNIGVFDGTGSSTLKDFVEAVYQEWNGKSLARVEKTTFVENNSNENFLIKIKYNEFDMGNNTNAVTKYYNAKNEELQINNYGTVSRAEIIINDKLIEKYTYAQTTAEKASAARKIKKTIIHELGHVFLLMHPHDRGCDTVCIMQQNASGLEA